MNLRVGSCVSSFLLATFFAGSSSAYYVRRDVNHSNDRACASNVNELACTTDGFKTLCAAVKAAGLDKALAGKGSFTVFAPNDDAFDKLPPPPPGSGAGNAVEWLTQPENNDKLKNILLFHVVAGKTYSSDDLRCTYLMEMENGKDSRTVCSGGKIYQKGGGNSPDKMPEIMPDYADIEVCNGVIHVVSEVMLPPKPFGHDEPSTPDEDEERDTPEHLPEHLPAGDCPDLATAKGPASDNPCEGKDPGAPSVACVVGEIGEQAGADVTKGYKGNAEAQGTPIMAPYWKAGLCPVNVHWHLGAEHRSAGQYDETGTGPSKIPKRTRRTAEGEVQKGFHCTLYDETDEKFTKPYNWKYCKDMEVGQTYEVHWPHSAAGACGTVHQWQTPFKDGVFCVAGVITDTAGQIGVQGQVFTIVNDESYYYPDLMRGMIIDGNMGKEITHYTGSTTGSSVNNEICSPYTPITWQVDRVCHMISASSFDKMCADMSAQNDDMTKDMKPYGSRVLVADDLAADNHVDGNAEREP